jgi:predicted nucleotidyltransferase
MDLAPAIEEILGQVPELDAIYLFCSVATGEARPDSDIDLAVLADRKLDPEARWRL